MNALLSDEHAVYFEIPAKDLLGRQAIVGKVRATHEAVCFHWRFKSQTFRKDKGQITEIMIPFEQVELVELKSTLGLFNHRLIFQVADPKLLASVPGVGVGRAVLFLAKGGKDDAKRFLKFLDFKTAEASAEAARKRLSDLGGETTL